VRRASPLAMDCRIGSAVSTTLLNQSSRHRLCSLTGSGASRDLQTEPTSRSVLDTRLEDVRPEAQILRPRVVQVIGHDRHEGRGVARTVVRLDQRLKRVRHDLDAGLVEREPGARDEVRLCGVSR
jgi:hypothetical protein